MVAIRDQRRTVNLTANSDAEYGYGFVAQKADHASGSKPAEMQHRTRLEETVDGLVSGHQCTEQND
jgi:hypothetical protein